MSLGWGGLGESGVCDVGFNPGDKMDYLGVKTAVCAVRDHAIVSLAVAFTVFIPVIMGIGFVTGVSYGDVGDSFIQDFRDTVITFFWGDWVSDFIMAGVSVFFLSAVIIGYLATFMVSPDILYAFMDYIAYIPYLILVFWVCVFVHLLVRWKNDR